MRILLLGAGGFIGRHILSDLLAVGHDVVGVARSTALLTHAHALRVKDWTPHLAGGDVLVNAAGLLRGRDLRAVHVAMPSALYQAAEASGVRHAVLISAISARPDLATSYSQTKLAGEAALPLQGLLKEPQGGQFIPLFRVIALENLTFVIHGTPKVMGLAI